MRKLYPYIRGEEHIARSLPGIQSGNPEELERMV